MCSKVCRLLVLLAVLIVLVCGSVIVYTDSSQEQEQGDDYQEKPCVLRKYPAGYVCVCNATYCDTLEEDRVILRDPNQLILFTTSLKGLRFHRTEGSWSDLEEIVVNDHNRNASSNISWLRKFFQYLGNVPRMNSNKLSVEVQHSIQYQTMMGFGGAVTGSVAKNLEDVPEALEDLLLKSYYSKQHGIGYTMLRMAIGGSDFDVEPWAYNDLPVNDVKLSNFTKLDPRDLAIIKRIRKIKELVEATPQRQLKIKAAAWGCPTWMRSPKRRGGPGHLKPEFYQTWANYHIRFLELMREQGIDIWAMSTGNEPLNGIVGWVFTHWMNLGWQPKDVAKYIVENLEPTLRNSPFKDTLLLAGDDQRSTFPWYFNDMRRAYPKVFDNIAGFAVHSYLDSYMPAEMLSWAQKSYPDKFILNTESSIGDVRYNPRGPLLGSWERAVEYISMYIQSFRNSVVGWIDWNLVLDELGGPNYVNNTVEAAIVVNATLAEAYKQPIFHAIGHFSKFIHEGSVRIEVHSDWSQVDTIGFLRPDNVIVVLIHNRYLDVIEVSLKTKDETRVAKVVQLPPDSITTVLYQKE